MSERGWFVYLLLDMVRGIYSAPIGDFLVPTQKRGNERGKRINIL